MHIIEECAGLNEGGIIMGSVQLDLQLFVSHKGSF